MKTGTNFDSFWYSAASETTCAAAFQAPQATLFQTLPERQLLRLLLFSYLPHLFKDSGPYLDSRYDLSLLSSIKLSSVYSVQF